MTNVVSRAQAVVGPHWAQSRLALGQKVAAGRPLGKFEARRSNTSIGFCRNASVVYPSEFRHIDEPRCRCSEVCAFCAVSIALLIGRPPRIRG